MSLNSILTSSCDFLKKLVRTITGHGGASRMTIAHSRYNENEPAQIKNNCNRIIESFERRLKFIEDKSTAHSGDEGTSF